MKAYIQKILISFSILIGFFLTGNGQNRNQFESILLNEGIIPNIVYCIEKDSFGNIWAGTDEGVIRYNSKNLFFYDRTDGLPENLSSRILSMFLDKKLRLWIGTYEGLSLYNPALNKFEFISLHISQGEPIANCIEEDGKGNIWFGGSSGLWKTDENLKKSTRLLAVPQINCLLPLGNKIYFGSDNGLFVYDILKHSYKSIGKKTEQNIGGITSLNLVNNIIYVGTQSNGLYSLNIPSNSVTKINIPVLQSKFPRINKVMEAGGGNILIASDGQGIIFLDKQNNFLSNARNNVNDENSISSDGIYDLIKTEDGAIWIATYGGGINRLMVQGKPFQNLRHIKNDPNSLINNYSRAIQEDNKGRIWIGTRKGLSIFDPKSRQWKNLYKFSSDSGRGEIILDIDEDNTYMYIGTYENGLFRIHKENLRVEKFPNNQNQSNGFGLKNIYAIEIDSKKNIWLGGIGGNLIKISPQNTITEYNINNVRDIQELIDGRILVAGRNGVQLINKDKVENIRLIQSRNSGLKYANINCVIQKKNGELLIGTNGNGLIFHKPGEKKFRVLSKQNGLPSDLVQSIELENDSSVWLGTSRGLVNLFFSPSDTIIAVFDKQDGLICNEFNYGSSKRLSDGRMMFGGVEGIVVFNPENIVNQAFIPKLVFEEFNPYGKNADEFTLDRHINFMDKIILKYYQNSFNIRFQGILNTFPSKVMYSWKMEGFRDEWSVPSTETTLNFIKLAPGNYFLRVKAANRDGLWSREKTLSIKVLDPWWRSGWAYFVYVILFLAAMGGLAYLLIAFVNKTKAEEQIQFFNSVTHELKTPLAILLSSLENFKPENFKENLDKVKTTSRQLTNLFEQLLNFHLSDYDGFGEIKVEPLDIAEEIRVTLLNFKPILETKGIAIEVINEYKDQEFFYDKFRLEKILLNLISNAVKYSKPQGLITIKLESAKGDLLLTVKDQGIGIPKDQQKFILKKYFRGRNAANSQEAGSGLGLIITRKMIEKQKGSISFESVENQGTTFYVKLVSQKYVDLEYKKENLPVIESAIDNEDLAEFSDVKILIVEDNDDLRINLVEKLGTYFQVYDATNGKNGLIMAEKIFPDIIITDSIMPEMNGLEMVKSLQENINLNHIPIIMMSVMTGQKERKESAEAGVTTYLEKPFSFDYLLTKILNILNWSKKMRDKYLNRVDIEHAEEFRNNRDIQFIESLENFIIQEIRHDKLSVYDLCRHVGMSRTALYMKLKSLIDLSPQNFIIHSRLKYARKKIMEGNGNIKEIAYMSGFTSPKYFSTSFKKIFGENPSSFSKKFEKNG